MSRPIQEHTKDIEAQLAAGVYNHELTEDELTHYCLFRQRCEVAARHLGGKASLRKKRGEALVKVRLIKEEEHA